jgi:VanZ family protein
VNARAAAVAARVIAGVFLCAAVFLLLVPSSVVTYLRRQWFWVGRFVDYLELFSTKGVNLTHLFVFGVLGLLAGIALPRWPVRRVLAWTIVIGAATELAQLWIPGRTPRFWDIVANAGGVLIGMAFASLLVRPAAK